MKCKRLLGVVLAVVLVLVVAGCSNSPDTNLNSPEEAREDAWLTYSTDQYSFEYPATWQEIDPNEVKVGIYPNLNVDVAMFDPNFDSQYEYATNAQVQITQHPFLAPYAKEQVEAGLQYLKMFGSTMGIKECELVGFEPIDFDGLNAGIATLEVVISQNDIPAMMQQLIVPYQNKTYCLNLSCPKGKWEDYQTTFERMLYSFELKE